jgi:hypothetical protein
MGPFGFAGPFGLAGASGLPVRKPYGPYRGDDMVVYLIESSGVGAASNKSSFFSPPASLYFNYRVPYATYAMLMVHTMHNCIHNS